MSLSLTDSNQEREIRDLAKVRSEPPEKVLSELVGKALGREPKSGFVAPTEPRKQEQAWDAFLLRMADWSKCLPVSHKVGDDRESIYAAEGE